MSHELPVFLRRDWLDVGDGHELHLVQCGNPDGIPLLYLHGGPVWEWLCGEVFDR
ncbi:MULTISPECIES: hypothetical protein [unclassified Shewanella]|uniref:hypothetical protein n=1 Tax=unclassified Shewanella TaxID=196818 RepID=UPI003FA3BD6E